VTDRSTHLDHAPPIVDDSGRSRRSRRPWIWLILGAFVVIAAGVAAVLLLRENGSPAEASGTDSLNFAEVVITDLIQEQTFNGTLGSIEDDPVTTQLGGTVTEIAEKGDTVSQGQALFAIDDQPVVLLYGELPAYRDIVIGEDTVTVSSHLNGTVTWVAEPGDVIQQGDILYRVNDQPVVALYGEQPAYRSLDIEGPNLAVAAAQASLSSAKANLTALTTPPSEQQIQATLQSLNAAQQATPGLA